MKKKKKGFERKEKRLYKMFTLTIIMLIIGIVYSRATLSKINLEVQNLSTTIKEKTEDNQSLVMKINEMVSLENIKELSDELGLTYNNDNIVSVIE